MDCTTQENIYASVTIRNKAQVDIKIREWMFNPGVSANPNKLYSKSLVNKTKHVLEILSNQIRKICKKNSKDQIYCELRERFIKLLENLGMTEMIGRTVRESNIFERLFKDK